MPWCVLCGLLPCVALTACLHVAILQFLACLHLHASTHDKRPPQPLCIHHPAAASAANIAAWAYTDALSIELLGTTAPGYMQNRPSWGAGEPTP